MKKTTAFVLFLFSYFFGRAQNNDTLFASPQAIALSISTPQPRLQETFQVSLDITLLQTDIFKPLAGKLQLSTHRASGTNNGLLMMNVSALKKGRNEIGPLAFYLDKTKYITNKIVYEVIDPLPETNKGLWLRKVMTSDSTFCIIIEQRIPARLKTTKTSENSFSTTTEPEFRDIVKFKDSYAIDGANSTNSSSSISFSSVKINGQEQQDMYGYSIYYFNIVEKTANIKITKEKFDNLPADFRFEDILIQ